MDQFNPEEPEQKFNALSVSEHIKQLKEKGKRPLFETGYSSLDGLIEGFRDGEMVIVGGRPGMGKSAFMLNLAKNQALKGNNVCVITLDQPSEEIALKLGTILLEKPSDEILKERSVQKQLKTDGKLLVAESTPDLYVLIREIREVAQAGVKFVFLDYIQMVSHPAHKLRRDHELQIIISRLKTLARELKIILIIGSQLSRSVEMRGGDKRPILADLRESGNLEEYADKVILLYRPEYYGITQMEDGKSTNGLTFIMIEKNKSGKTGECVLHFNGSILKFEEFTKEQTDSFSDSPDDSWVNDIPREDTPF